MIEDWIFVLMPLFIGNCRLNNYIFKVNGSKAWFPFLELVIGFVISLKLGN
jgi:hypothetical protein